MDSTKNTTPSKKSIIRKEALLALFILFFLIGLYIYFFLSFHLKWVIERAAFQSIGSEVNISNLKVDFLKPSLALEKIEITNPEKPEQNIIEIKNIDVNFLYKPLLRSSFVSDKTEVRQIEFHKKRVRPGKVLPPEKRLLVFSDPSQNKVEDYLKEKYKASILSDISDLISGKNKASLKKEYQEKLQSLQASAEVKKQVEDIENDYKALETHIKSDGLKELVQEVKNFKFNSGSTAESLASSKKAIDLIEKLKKERSFIKERGQKLKFQVDRLKTEVKNSPENFMKDVSFLKASLDPSQLSGEKLSEGLLSRYFSVQLNQMSRVTSSLKSEALGSKERYVDKAREIKKKTSDATEKVTQSDLEKKRAQKIAKEGRDFIFYKKAVLPKFWFKKIDVSSRAHKGQDIGDVKGYIANFASPQLLVPNPLEVNLKGSVLKQNIGSFYIDALIDQRMGKLPNQKIDINVTDYLVQGLKLFDGGDEMIKIVKSNSDTNLSLNISEGKMNLNLAQKLKRPDYAVEADNKNMQSLLSKLKSNKEDIFIELSATGNFKSPKISFRSNFGQILMDTVKAELKTQVSDQTQIQIQRLREKSQEELEPYLKKINLTVGDVEKLSSNYDTIIKDSIKKLRESNKDKIKDKVEEKAKKALDKIFKSL